MWNAPFGKTVPPPTKKGGFSTTQKTKPPPKHKKKQTKNPWGGVGEKFPLLGGLKLWCGTTTKPLFFFPPANPNF